MKRILCFLSLILWSTPLFAEMPKGDPVLGQIKAKTCLKCHGTNEGRKYPTIPNLAGQKRLYIERQIKNFRSSDFKKPRFLSKREHPMMANKVGNLTDQDITDVAAFFSAQECQIFKPSQTLNPPPNVASRCRSCHGDVGGTGRYSLVPDLFGQNSNYLQNQLMAFYSATGKFIFENLETKRHHRIMTRQAGYLKLSDIKAIADYFASIPCR